MHLALPVRRLPFGLPNKVYAKIDVLREKRIMEAYQKGCQPKGFYQRSGYSRVHRYEIGECGDYEGTKSYPNIKKGNSI